MLKSLSFLLTRFLFPSVPQICLGLPPESRRSCFLFPGTALWNTASPDGSFSADYSLYLHTGPLCSLVAHIISALWGRNGQELAGLAIPFSAD